MVVKSISTLTRHGKILYKFLFFSCIHKISQLGNEEMQVIKKQRSHEENSIAKTLSQKEELLQESCN
jgi:hypothetical protein